MSFGAQVTHNAYYRAFCEPPARFDDRQPTSPSHFTEILWLTSRVAHAPANERGGERMSAVVDSILIDSNHTGKACCA
jgi:hypothetical protein